MKITERISTALRVLTQGTPYPVAKAKKPAVVMWPTWKEGKDATWVMTDLSKYIDEGFDLNAIIYSAIMYKVFAASAAPLRAYVGDRDAREPAPPEVAVLWSALPGSSVQGPTAPSHDGTPLTRRRR